MTELIVKAVLAYLLGSLVGSLILGRFSGVDIRTQGSGNAGATNALRTQGKAMGLTVLVIDLAKGWVATAWLARAALPLVPAAAAEYRDWLVPACGIAVMIGHINPLWYGFRGGKGVATLVGVVLGVGGALLLAFLLTFLVAVMIFGWVSLGSILGAAAVAVAIACGGYAPRVPLLTFAVLATLLIVYTHRGNLGRIRAGTESRARKLWLFRGRAAG